MPQSANTRRQARVISVTLAVRRDLCLGSASSPAQRPAGGESGRGGGGTYSLEQVMSYPYPADLVASPSGERLAWTFDDERRPQPVGRGWPRFHGAAPGHVYAGGRPGVKRAGVLGRREMGGLRARRRRRRELGRRPQPDAQSDQQPGPAAPADLGGARGRRRAARARAARRRQRPVLLGEGDLPVPSPDGQRVAFEKDNEIWVAPIDGSKPASRMFFSRGRNDIAGVVAGRTHARLRHHARQPRLHRPLQRRESAAAVSVAVECARRESALVAGRHAHRVRAPPGPRRSGRAAARSAAAAVVDLGRRCEDGRGAGGVALARDAAGVDAEHAGRRQSQLG